MCSFSQSTIWLSGWFPCWFRLGSFIPLVGLLGAGLSEDSWVFLYMVFHHQMDCSELAWKEKPIGLKKEKPIPTCLSVFCLLYISWCPVGQSKSHDQDQRPCGRGLGIVGGKWIPEGPIHPETIHETSHHTVFQTFEIVSYNFSLKKKIFFLVDGGTSFWLIIIVKCVILPFIFLPLMITLHGIWLW